MKFGLVLGLALGMIAGGLLVKNSSCACDIVSKAQHVVADKFKSMAHGAKDVAENVSESMGC